MSYIAFLSCHEDCCQMHSSTNSGEITNTALSHVGQYILRKSQFKEFQFPYVYITLNIRQSGVLLLGLLLCI